MKKRICPIMALCLTLCLFFLNGCASTVYENDDVYIKGTNPMQLPSKAVLSRPGQGLQNMDKLADSNGISLYADLQTAEFCIVTADGQI